MDASQDASKLPEVLTGKPNFESLLGHAELNQAASGNLKYPQQEEYDFPKDEDASQRSMQQSANDSAAESTNAEATHPTASLPLGNGETTCKYTHVGDGKLIIEINLKFKGSTPALSLLVPDITVP